MVSQSVIVHDPYLLDPEFVEYTKRSAVNSLLNSMEVRASVVVQEAPGGDPFTTDYTASLGVLSSEAVRGLEEQINARAKSLVQEVMTRADAGIQHWESSYGGTSILKSRAVDEFHRAFQKTFADEKRRGS